MYSQGLRMPSLPTSMLYVLLGMAISLSIFLFPMPSTRSLVKGKVAYYSLLPIVGAISGMELMFVKCSQH